jgi:hypothetical protein
VPPIKIVCVLEGERVSLMNAATMHVGLVRTPFRRTFERLLESQQLNPSITMRSLYVALDKEIVPAHGGLCTLSYCSFFLVH